MGAETLDIVIVGFRPGPETERLLGDLPVTTKSSYELHYFDNTGNPKSLSQAWNDLAFAGSAPYIAILNSDVIPSPAWDLRMIEALDDETIGSVMPGAIPCVGKYLGVDVGFHMPPTREDMRHASDIAVEKSAGKPLIYDYGKEQGAYYSVMLRRADFELLKGFDERLRFYAQDHDFQDRLRMRGMKNIRLDSCPFFHGDSVATKKAIANGDIDIMAEYKTIGLIYYPIRDGQTPRWDALSDDDRKGVRADPIYRMSNRRRS